MYHCELIVCITVAFTLLSLCHPTLGLNNPASSSSPAPNNGLLFGVASSAFQVEGWPADSNWYRWTHTAGKIVDNSTADMGTQFWQRFEEDFQLAASIGLSAYRLSIAWERIQPSAGGSEYNSTALQHYCNMMSTARVYGLEPIVTLLHSVLPVWLSDGGGVLAPTFITDYSSYISIVVPVLASSSCGSVKYFLTFNEPTTFAEGAYIDGNDPPGMNDRADLFLEAILQQSTAHTTSVRSLRQSLSPALNQSVQFSIAQDYEVFRAQNASIPLEELIAGIPRYFYSQFVLDAAYESNTLDFIGINYYTVATLGLQETFPYIVEVPCSNCTHDDMNTEVHPEGLLLAAREIVSRYPNRSILFTENGLADALDSRRPEYLVDHFDYLQQAVFEEQLPIIGYCHWSLTDNFEWSNGLSMRFGLVEMDYADDFKRVPRPSFQTYAQLVQQWKEKEERRRLVNENDQG